MTAVRFDTRQYIEHKLLVENNGTKRMDMLPYLNYRLFKTYIITIFYIVNVSSVKLRDHHSNNFWLSVTDAKLDIVPISPRRDFETRIIKKTF